MSKKSQTKPVYDAALIDFAKFVLEVLEADREWDADTTDKIGIRAIRQGLAKLGKEQEFVVAERQK